MENNFKNLKSVFLQNVNGLLNGFNSEEREVIVTLNMITSYFDYIFREGVSDEI